jgi:4-hydroxy-tetrahydrodipicolinate synthase
VTAEFTIGDKAVYPSQGVAEVVGIEKKEVYGKIQNFYVLRGLDTGLRILVPVDKADQVGLRKIAGDAEIEEVMEILRERQRNFRVFSGDDGTALPFIALGGDGLVSVCSNEIPKETSKMIDYALAGSFRFARKIHYKILPLMAANFIESSPGPCKFVMKEMGLLEENLRLPLVPVGKDSQAKLRTVLNEIGKLA